MTSADWLILAGYLLLIIGAGAIYRPAGFLVAGIVCILLGRAAIQHPARKRHPLAHAPEDLE